MNKEKKELLKRIFEREYNGNSLTATEASKIKKIIALLED